MKVGDYVKSTKIRPEESAKVVKAKIYKRPNYTKTEYVARFDDGSEFIFYGSQVNKSVFKDMTERDGQMNIFDFINN